MKRSKLFDRILDGVNKKKIKEPFNVDDVSNIIKTSDSFLSKHAVGNPGGYKEYFIRKSKGKYFINRKII